MTAETWLCVNCLVVGDLTPTGKCASCGSDSVVSTARVASLVGDSATPHEFSPLKTHGWLIQYQGFETFISWREASSVEEAIERATHDTNQAWYGIPGSVSPIEGVTGRPVTHNDYCDWLRREDVKTNITSSSAT